MTDKPRRTSAGARRSAEASAAILRAARDLLGERGYRGFTIEEVAKRAGSAKTTIYKWWPSKSALLAEIYAAEKEMLPRPEVSSSLLDDLARHTSGLWRFWQDNVYGDVVRGLIAEAQGDARQVESLRTVFLEQRLDVVRPLFEAAALREEFGVESIEERLELWVGLNWFHLLTAQLDVAPDRLKRQLALICQR
jgi:AcrR family transcriptional regulator